MGVLYTQLNTSSLLHVACIRKIIVASGIGRVGDSNDHGEGDVPELNVSFNENSIYTKLLFQAGHRFHRQNHIDSLTNIID